MQLEIFQAKQWLCCWWQSFAATRKQHPRPVCFLCLRSMQLVLTLENQNARKRKKRAWPAWGKPLPQLKASSCSSCLHSLLLWRVVSCLLLFYFFVTPLLRLPPSLLLGFSATRPCASPFCCYLRTVFCRFVEANLLDRWGCLASSLAHAVWGSSHTFEEFVCFKSPPVLFSNALGVYQLWYNHAHRKFLRKPVQSIPRRAATTRFPQYNYARSKFLRKPAHGIPRRAPTMHCLFHAALQPTFASPLRLPTHLRRPRSPQRVARVKWETQFHLHSIATWATKCFLFIGSCIQGQWEHTGLGMQQGRPCFYCSRVLNAGKSHVDSLCEDSLKECQAGPKHQEPWPRKGSELRRLKTGSPRCRPHIPRHNTISISSVFSAGARRGGEKTLWTAGRAGTAETKEGFAGGKV